MIPLIICFLILSNGVLSQNLPLPPLLYPYDGLEPYFDEETMKIHHLKHHDGYRKKINYVLSVLRSNPETKHFAKMGIYELLSELDKVPSKHVTSVRNNGGGFINHFDFFESLAPSGVGGGGDESFISIPLQQSIVRSYGTYEDFKKTFKEVSLERFGSGWI
jgi:Fe-Mn family superoxide dismutase